MSVGETNDATWYVDSAASAHMTPSEGQSLGSNSPSESSKGNIYPLSPKSLCSHPQALVAVQQSGDV